MAGDGVAADVRRHPPSVTEGMLATPARAATKNPASVARGVRVAFSDEAGSADRREVPVRLGGPVAPLHHVAKVFDCLHLDVPEAELARRKAAWVPPPLRYARSYGVLLERHIGQANDGADFDFLEQGAPVPEPEIF